MKPKSVEHSTTANLGSRMTPGASGERAAVPAHDAETAPSLLFAVGAIVADKYLVDGVLGQGGLGVVVSATHLHLDQKVAIKYLRGSAPRDRAVTDRFLREARLAAQIKSDHVVRVFDVATLADGTPYMVMEHLQGSDLRTVLEDRTLLPLEIAIDFVLQACEAVAEAHVEGIVHRDLKPDNLFLARRSGGKDVLKVLDFGISKLSERYASSSRVNVVTQAGDRLGTPLYMSPEQLEGDPNVDARTDLWALGVVLYELCTGSIPFAGDSLPALCTAVLTKTPIAASVLRPELPAKLDQIISRCLAKSRDDRYANVAELAQELGVLATPLARTRVEHIVQTITDSGDSVRPSRWDHIAAASDTDKLASEAPSSFAPASAPRRNVVPWVLAGALLGGVLIAWTAHRITHGARAVSAASPSVMPAPPERVAEEARAVAPPTDVPAPKTVVPTETGSAAPLTVGSAPSAASRITTKPPPKSPVGQPHTASPGGARAPIAPSSSDTSGVIDPFQ